MNSIFAQQSIENQWTDATPLDAPVVLDPARGNWVNNGVKFYKQVFGNEAYEDYGNDMPIPMAAGSPALSRQKTWRLFKRKLMFGFKALATGRRATHMRGVGARGRVKIVDAPEFPEHDFFSAGREFPCRIRHANASFYDDASIQVRGFSIKFADSQFESPLDVIMNSGATAAFWSFSSFMAFVDGRMKCTEENWEGQREFMRLLPTAYLGTIESVRVAPSSWDDVTYYSKIAFPFRARDGVTRYCKYRAIRCGLEHESGLVGDSIQQQPWVQCRQPNESKPVSYLVDEYNSRLSAGPIVYKLQIQIRDWQSDDTAEFFNLSRYWDETQYPWRDLADVIVESPLDESETDRMAMWLGHQPPSLGLTAADSVDDYRSLAWGRYHIYPASRRSRWLLRTLHMQRRLKTDF